MRKAKKGKPSRPTRRRSALLKIPKTPQEPTYEELAQEIRLLKEHLTKGAFSNFVIMGYRRVPPSERAKYNGAKEAPFYFYHFPKLFEAGALADWMCNDVQQHLIAANKKRKQEEQGPVQVVPKGGPGLAPKAPAQPLETPTPAQAAQIDEDFFEGSGEPEKGTVWKETVDVINDSAEPTQENA